MTPFLRKHTDVLERLAGEMYARGLSTRDIEDAPFEVTGDRILSKSSVTRVTEVLWEEFFRGEEEDKGYTRFFNREELFEVGISSFNSGKREVEEGTNGGFREKTT